jgi:hypothetical protein
VDSVQHADGRCEFLGVAGFAAGEADGELAVAPVAHAGARIDAQPLPMPYPLPA